MRMLVQRVKQAAVSVAGEGVVGEIGPGLLVLLGVEAVDGPEDVAWLAAKLVGMRVFADAEGKMNRDVREIGGGVLVVSQFTLHASTKKGNRPSFIRAARPEVAIPLYEAFLAEVARLREGPVACGRFGADMEVALINDGPVTVWVDSRNRE